MNSRVGTRQHSTNFLKELTLKRSFTGKFLFASLIVTFRHGREEDEIMGISFKKELVVDRVQVHPPGKDESRTKLQVTLSEPR